VSGGQVLLVRHTYGPLEWELPGGGSRRGEPAETTMRRELREEVGIEVAGALELGTGRGSGRYARARVIYFSAELADRAAVVRDPVEIAEVAWFDPAQTPRPLGIHAAQALSLYNEAIASPQRDPGSPARG
jgi:8-oxo-dGTP pyrophosphatase MutT (NUDIX family)